MYIADCQQDDCFTGRMHIHGIMGDPTFNIRGLFPVILILRGAFRPFQLPYARSSCGMPAPQGCTLEFAHSPVRSHYGALTADGQGQRLLKAGPALVQGPVVPGPVPTTSLVSGPLEASIATASRPGGIDQKQTTFYWDGLTESDFRQEMPPTCDALTGAG